MIKVIKNPYKLFMYLGYKGWFNWVIDDMYLRFMFHGIMGYKLDLKNPRTLNEKIQWLKINDRRAEYTSLVDKYHVRNHVSSVLGEEYLIPLLGVWEGFEDIDFSKLPNQFVLKPNHTSGDVYICRDKSQINMMALKKQVNSWMKREYFWTQREWPYKNIKPRIICEKLIETNNGDSPPDYKFMCFNGTVDNVMICLDRDKGKPKFYYFDSNWNYLRYNKCDIDTPENFTIPKPKQMDKMFNIAKVLSENYFLSRIDLYCQDDKIYFGEITLYPDSGFDRDITIEADRIFGEKLRLPIEYV